MCAAEPLKWEGYFLVLLVLAGAVAAQFLLVTRWCASVLKLLVVICLLLLARAQPLA